MALSIQKSLEAYGLDSYHKGRHEWGLLLGWDSTCICPLQHIRKQIMIWLTHNIYIYVCIIPSIYMYTCTWCQSKGMWSTLLCLSTITQRMLQWKLQILRTIVWHLRSSDVASVYTTQVWSSPSTKHYYTTWC